MEGRQGAEGEEAAEKAARGELALTETALRKNPKSYSTWHYRRWIVSKKLTPLEHELELIGKCATLITMSWPCSCCACVPVSLSGFMLFFGTGAASLGTLTRKLSGLHTLTDCQLLRAIMSCRKLRPPLRDASQDANPQQLSVMSCHVRSAGTSSRVRTKQSSHVTIFQPCVTPDGQD